MYLPTRLRARLYCTRVSSERYDDETPITCTPRRGCEMYLLRPGGGIRCKSHFLGSLTLHHSARGPPPAPRRSDEEETNL